MYFPKDLLHVLQNAPIVGIAGARHSVGADSIKALTLAVSNTIWTGDSLGVSERVIDYATKNGKNIRVFSTKGKTITERTEKTVTFLDELAKQEGAVLVGFGINNCSKWLKPTSNITDCFRDIPPESWRSLAYGIGLGIPTFFHASWDKSNRWGLEEIGDHWYASR